MPRIVRSKAPPAVVYLVAGFLLLATALTSNAAAQSAVASPEAFPDCLGVDLGGRYRSGLRLQPECSWSVRLRQIGNGCRLWLRQAWPERVRVRPEHH